MVLVGLDLDGCLCIRRSVAARQTDEEDGLDLALIGVVRPASPRPSDTCAPSEVTYRRVDVVQ